MIVTPFPPLEKRALQPFDLIHADLIELPIRSYQEVGMYVDGRLFIIYILLSTSIKR